MSPQKAVKRPEVRRLFNVDRIATDGSGAPRGLFVTCAQLPMPHNWHMRSHAHANNNELSIVVQGTLRVTIAGRTLDAQPGDILNYPVGVVHEEWSVGSEPLRTLFVVWCDHGQDTSGALPLITHDRRERARFLVQMMIALNTEEPDPQQRAQLQGRLLSAVLHEVRAVHAPPEDDRIERVRRHLQTRLDSTPTIASLAKIAGVSRFHLIRIFQRRLGMTPMEYLRHQRIEAAKVMIRSRKHPLRVIAPMVGFGDEFHLSKAFKSLVGVTPSAYRKASMPT